MSRQAGPRRPDAAAGDDAFPGRVALFRHGAVDSTNRVARDLVRRGAAPAWTVVSARTQTAGRGRHGRDWVSPPGNLYSSTIVYPPAAPRERAQLSLIAGLAVAEMASAVVANGARISLKWPNDVLVGGRKVSGILLETCPAPSGPEAVIIGVGVNVAAAPSESRYGAAALCMFAAAPPALAGCLARYLRALADWYDVWERDGFARVRTAWLARAHGLGAPVAVCGAGGDCRGRFVGLSPDGLMQLRSDDGVVHEIAAGTVGFVGSGAS